MDAEHAERGWQTEEDIRSLLSIWAEGDQKGWDQHAARISGRKWKISRLLTNSILSIFICVRLFESTFKLNSPTGGACLFPAFATDFWLTAMSDCLSFQTYAVPAGGQGWRHHHRWEVEHWLQPIRKVLSLWVEGSLARQRVKVSHHVRPPPQGKCCNRIPKSHWCIRSCTSSRCLILFFLAGWPGKLTLTSTSCCKWIPNIFATHFSSIQPIISRLIVAVSQLTTDIPFACLNVWRQLSTQANWLTIWNLDRCTCVRVCG